MLHTGVAGTQIYFCVAVLRSRHKLDDHWGWLHLFPGTRLQTQLSQADAVKIWLLSSQRWIEQMGSQGWAPPPHLCIIISEFPSKQWYLNWETHSAWQWVQIWCWDPFMVISLSMVVVKLLSLHLCSPLLNVSQIFQHHLIKYFFKITVLQKDSHVNV